MIVLVDDKINKKLWGELCTNSPFSSPFQPPEFYEFYNSVDGFSEYVFSVKGKGKLTSLYL